MMGLWTVSRNRLESVQLVACRLFIVLVVNFAFMHINFLWDPAGCFRLLMRFCRSLTHQCIGFRSNAHCSRSSVAVWFINLWIRLSIASSFYRLISVCVGCTVTELQRFSWPVAAICFLLSTVVDPRRLALLIAVKFGGSFMPVCCFGACFRTDLCVLVGYAGIGWVLLHRHAIVLWLCVIDHRG